MTSKFMTAAEAAHATGKNSISTERLALLREYVDQKIRHAADHGESKVFDAMRGFQGEVTQSEAHRLVGALKSDGFDCSGHYHRANHDRGILPRVSLDIYW